MYLKFSYLISLLTLTITFGAFGQGTYSAIKAGDWNDPTTWNLTSGTDDDADGIPDSNDDVIITNFQVNVRTTQSAKSIIISATSLNVSFFITSAGFLTVANNFTINSSNTANRFARITLAIGTLDVRGNIIYNNPRLVTNGGFLIRNENALANFDKRIFIGGDLNQNLGNRFSFNINGVQTDAVNLVLNGGIPQRIQGNIATSIIYSKIFIDNGSTLMFLANNDAPNIIDSVKVRNGTIRLNEVNMSNVNGFPNQITVFSGSKISVTNNILFPDHMDINNLGFVTDMLAGSISEWDIATGFTRNILTKAFNYRNVNLLGAGTKVITSNISGLPTEAMVNDLTVSDGVLEIPASITNISNITGTITIKSGATLRILGNPILPASGQFVFEPGSIVEYRSNAAQTILGGVNFANLSFLGTGVKTTSAPFSFQGELAFNNNGVLNINHDITIESDINRTGFVSAIPNGYTINYNASQFITKRHVITSTIDVLNAAENYRDFSLPVTDAQSLLSQFDDDNPFPAPSGTFPNGFPELPIFGITNSNYPPRPNQASNVNEWNSTTGMFERPADYNATIVKKNGLGAITTNAVRFSWGDDDGLTLIARGQINRGDKDFNATFNAVNDFNLFGNPYPCALSFEAIVAGNANINNSGSGIIPTVYMVAPDQVGTGTLYTFYNAETNVGTATNGIIPAYQGFFLQTTAAAPASFNFTIRENMKEAADRITYKRDNNDAPDLFDISVSKNSIIQDRIHFYFFDNASNGFDEILDVEKLEASNVPYSGPTVSFNDGKKDLNILANAISNTSNELNLNFTVNNPEAGTSKAKDLELELSGLNELFSNFNCVYLENTLTGDTYDITGNFLSITIPANTSQAKYTIRSIKAPDLFRINTADATCFGFEDGILRVDMSDIPQNSPINLFKDKKLFESFSSTNNVYKRNVGAGNYEFKISGISQACTYSYSTSIDQDPEVIADFILPDSLFIGRDLVFKNNSSNETNVEWFGPDAKPLFTDSVVFNFDSVGQYFLKLTAIGNYSTCKDEELKFFYVDSLPSTSVGINEKALSNLASDLKIFTTPESLTLKGLNKGVNVNLINEVGQTLKTGVESNGIVTFAGIKSGIYIVEIALQNDRYSTKVAVQ